VTFDPVARSLSESQDGDSEVMHVDVYNEATRMDMNQSAAISEERQEVKPIQRRRRWTADQKKAIVDEIERQGLSTSAAARKYGISLRLLFSWRRNMRQQLLGSNPEIQSIDAEAAEAAQLKLRVRELEKMLGRQMLENQQLRQALEHASVQTGISPSAGDSSFEINTATVN
jgi:transposase-like protein